jgi:hypothetical protein
MPDNDRLAIYHILFYVSSFTPFFFPYVKASSNIFFLRPGDLDGRTSKWFGRIRSFFHMNEWATLTGRTTTMFMSICANRSNHKCSTPFTALSSKDTPEISSLFFFYIVFRSLYAAFKLNLVEIGSDGQHPSVSVSVLYFPCYFTDCLYHRHFHFQRQRQC